MDGIEASGISGMSLYRRSAPTACTSAAYEPRLIVFVQGQKRINLGKTTYLCDGSTFLLTSVDLPVVSQVIAATEKEPMLGLLLKLEMPLIREILSQQEFHRHEESTDARGMAIGVTSVELLDACSRLVDLLDTPQDIPFLGSLIDVASSIPFSDRDEPTSVPEAASPACSARAHAQRRPRCRECRLRSRL